MKYRILDLKHGDYVRARIALGDYKVGDIVLWPTYESAELRLDKMPALLKYQKRIKEQFVIEEVPDV
jgi:hypothetical protein